MSLGWRIPRERVPLALLIAENRFADLANSIAHPHAILNQIVHIAPGEGGWPSDLPRENLGLLHICAAFNSLECFALLISKGLDIAQLSLANHRPVHYACALNSLEVLCYILGKLPSEAACPGTFLLATRGRHLQALEVLLDYAPSFDPPDEQSADPIIAALNNRDSQCLELLLQHRARPGRARIPPLLTQAVKTMDPKCVRLLLDSGESLDESSASSKNSPLQMACFLRYEEIAEMLAEKAISVDPPLGMQSTEGCVHWICRSKSPRIARAILARSPDVARVDENGFVGPHYLVDAAADAEAIAILELLVQYKWDVNQPNGYNRSNLLGEYAASMTKSVPVMKWLVEHGANLEMPAMQGRQTILDALRDLAKGKRKELGEVIDLWENQRQRQ